ncbi:maleylpyruvate isomerase family mycothiol-dependent enzyme [Plantibacter flavus]|uniref:maleylpyruvate isomerase family mycothiol-dependent enzyme n=1 Tax=Plantibacter flavus TaxID=150123 RepID=UPI003F1456B3
MTDLTRYDLACGAFLRLVAGIDAAQWTRPGLGVWDVRALVGHTSRAIITVIDYLEIDAPETVSLESAADYYGQIYLTYTNPDAIALRGVRAGEALGDEPVEHVAALRERAVAAIAAQGLDRIVSIGGMGIPLGEYLRTRIFELVVHSLDIARATGQDAAIPPALVEEAASLAAGIAALRGEGERVLLALTGRDPLPEGFSVV